MPYLMTPEQAQAMADMYGMGIAVDDLDDADAPSTSATAIDRTEPVDPESLYWRTMFYAPMWRGERALRHYEDGVADISSMIAEGAETYVGFDRTSAPLVPFQAPGCPPTHIPGPAYTALPHVTRAVLWGQLPRPKEMP